MNSIDYKYLREIENKIKNKQSIVKEELSYFLTGLVYDVRSKIWDEKHPDFEFKCDLAQSIISYYLNDIGIVNYPYSTKTTFCKSISGHSFIVATFNVNGKNINYLIDPTYIQFFNDKDCSEDNYYYADSRGVYVKTPAAGYFVRKEIIGEDAFKRIISFRDKGFDVLDEELAKIYGDSFYNTRPMKKNKKIDSLPGYYYINSLLEGGIEKLSKTKEELIRDGYYINFDVNKSIKL